MQASEPARKRFDAPPGLKEEDIPGCFQRSTRKSCAMGQQGQWPARGPHREKRLLRMSRVGKERPPRCCVPAGLSRTFISRRASAIACEVAPEKTMPPGACLRRGHTGGFHWLMISPSLKMVTQLFFDCESSDLINSTSLISAGIITQTGDQIR